MKDFIKHFSISQEDYTILKTMILDREFVQAIKLFCRVSGRSLQESHFALIAEFKVEYKFYRDRQIYDCIEKIENSKELNNLNIASDIGVLLEYVKEQLTK